MKNNNNNQVYEKITEKVISLIESKPDLNWVKSWKGAGVPQNYTSNKKYSGINSFNLFLHMTFNEFTSNHYLTFNQIKKAGGHLKKGSEGMPIIYFNISEYNLKICSSCNLSENYCKCGSKSLEKKTFNKSFAKVYYVFNYEQTEGLKDKTQINSISFNPIEQAEEILNNFSNVPELQHETQRAFYNKVEDFVNMPKKNTFTCEEEYYSTLFHELTHSTGHEARLNRSSLADSANFGDKAYSYEELVAELGSIFLCNESGIVNKTLNNSTAYLKGWVAAMKENPQILFKAAKEAQTSTNYILNLN